MKSAIKTYILLTAKPWHDTLFRDLSKRANEDWIRISAREEFTTCKLMEINPNRIFIPHWSHIIPPEIFENFECIVFHMTDLPYGRGGSPLQNLIARGHENTKISAIRVDKGIDTGEVYLKKNLNLNGSAEEIFLRSAAVIKEMIKEIIDSNLQPEIQKGEITNFKRRKPEDGNIAELEDIQKIYDFIRMLDAPGYPKAFLEIGNMKLEFTRASLKADKSILADVRITEK